MLRSNAGKVFDNLVQVLSKYKPDDELLSAIAFDIHASNLRRVHQQGVNFRGRAIGSYSTKPIYVNPANSPVKFSPQGKSGETSFKSGRKRKTRYFSGGYKGFKRKIGRLQETSNVNLTLFGDLRRGFIPERRGNRWVIGVVGKQVLKYNALVKRYGPFYGVSREDSETTNKILKKRLQQIK